jgi:GntR family transcriptional regulator
MPFEIDKSSSLPVYAQLAEQIRWAIRDGRLSVGDGMPTVRQLAVDLRLNANTVARVYRDLQTEGILRLERGVGTFVAATAAPPLDKRRRRSIENTTDRLIGIAVKAGMTPTELSQLIETRWKEVADVTR